MKRDCQFLSHSKMLGIQFSGADHKDATNKADASILMCFFYTDTSQYLTRKLSHHSSLSLVT